ncbi:GvpL/GvpF family gas vesicle protein [Streptomyces sp. NPDC002994]|uniref:GvpL/GvpF family gas vesicle protein n=1 Tax=Streptomyces sp. NPDC002994 TaxID=3154441 RepID=UPI00339E5C1A
MNELRYVYAVTRPFDGVPPEGVRGLDGEPPRLLHHRDLVAVVSPVPAEDFAEAPLKRHLESLDWLSATARTHEAVVGALTAVTSPVPLRLATVCVDDSGVRRLLDAGHDRFVQTLERLEGRVEWGVKVYADPEPEPQPAEVPQVQAPATGRDYLRRRLSRRQARESVWERAETMSRTLHAELSLCAEAAVLHRPQDSRLSETPGQNILNAAYLVSRERGEAFVAEVGRLTPKDPGVRVELTGPWAPYSFAGHAGQEETAGP